MKEKRIEFVAGHQAAGGLQPSDGVLNDPPPAESAEATTVLRWRPNATTAIGTDELNVALCQALSLRIAVRGSVINQPTGDVFGNRLSDRQLDQFNFGRACAIDVDGEWETGAAHQNNVLDSFVSSGGADAITFFFAESNVPLANLSVQSMAPCSSNCLTSRRHSFSQTPSADHSAKRRQHVTYDGNEGGKSFQRVPLVSTETMSSRHRSASARGRSLRGSGDRSENRPAMSAQSAWKTLGSVGKLGNCDQF